MRFFLASLVAVAMFGAGWVAHPLPSGAPRARPAPNIPAATTVPGWVPTPQGGLNPGAQVCYGAACYRVDGEGDPYGQPFGRAQ